MYAKICDNKNNGCNVVAELDPCTGILLNKKDLFWYRICIDIEVKPVSESAHFNNVFGINDDNNDIVMLDHVVYDLCSTDCLVEKSNEFLTNTPPV